MFAYLLKTNLLIYAIIQSTYLAIKKS